MPMSSHVQLGWEDLRALSAATAALTPARRAWVDLMARLPFDEINENTQRVMPAIFANLRDAPDLPERDRMRGAFKYTWSRNTEMLHGLRPVLAALTVQGIDYRLIKGAAVQVVCMGLGSRAMGDVDVLVGATDVDRVVDVMESHGFRRGTYSSCSGHADAEHHGALNFNNADCHADVHVAEYKYPVRLLSEMLSAPARDGRAAGVLVRVPPTELLLLHAAVHGSMASGPTDFVQAVVDVAMLSQRVDRRRLLLAARRTGTLLHLLELDEAVRAVGAPSLGLEPPRLERAAARTQATLLRLGDLATESSSVARRLRARQRGASAQARVARDFNGHRREYGAWLRLGQFAFVERSVLRASGGFLPEPGDDWVSGATCRPFSTAGIPGLTASTVSSSVLDWRFRVRLPGPQAHLRLTLDSPSLDTLDAFVFENGRPITRVVAGDRSSRSIYLRNLPASVEFSLRPLWAVCTQCYRGLDDLQVRIDLGDDAR